MNEEVNRMHCDVDEIRKEWKSFKNKALLILTVGVVGYGIWVGTIQTRIAHNENAIETNGAKIESLVESQNGIQIQLARIETILIEIQKQVNTTY